MTRHACAHTRLCPDTLVPTHICPHTRLCPDMIVPTLLCPFMIAPSNYCSAITSSSPTGIFRNFIITCQGTKYVSGHKLVWAQTYTFLAKHYCDHTIITCQGTNVCGHKMCLGTNVCGHKRVWAQACVGTNVSGHERV